MRAGALEAAFAPAFGGALHWLTRDGVDILRRTAPGATDPLAMTSFPLVPYANRIAHGRFDFDGQSHQLPLNFGDHPHSLHGLGWQAKWTATETGAAHVTMVHDHAGMLGWPWPYRAEQRVSLTASDLSISLSLENLSDAPMPAGLGFHPYFEADEHTTLCFDADGLWLSTPDMLPDRQVPADTLGDWSRPAPVLGDSLIDNAYAGWTGPVQVVRGDGTGLTLSATGADWLHVYRPPGERFFCAEPVTHMPDAIHRGGMPVLAPGATAHLSMTIAVSHRDHALSQSGGIA